MEHWGNVFENYINESLKEVYPNPFSIFHPDTEFESKEKHFAFDGIVEYSRQILVMEYKSRSMKIDARYSGSSKLLLDEMDKHFGRQGRGISQIVNNLEFLFNTDFAKRKKIKDLNSSKIKVVYPILIFNDLSIEFGLANWKLTEWFIEEKNNKQISSEITVEPLLVLTIKNLEDLIPYLLNGDFTLLDFLQFYRNFRNIDKNWQYVDLTKTDEYHPMIGIREIISIFLRSRNVKSRSNEKLKRIWNDFFQKLEILFNI